MLFVQPGAHKAPVAWGANASLTGNSPSLERCQIPEEIFPRMDAEKTVTCADFDLLTWADFISICLCAMFKICLPKHADNGKLYLKTKQSEASSGK